MPSSSSCTLLYHAQVREKLVESLHDAWRAAKWALAACEEEAASSSSAGPKQQRALDEARERWATLAVLDPSSKAADARLWFRPPPPTQTSSQTMLTSPSPSSEPVSPTAGSVGSFRLGLSSSSSSSGSHHSSGNLYGLGAAAAASADGGETLPVGGCGDGWEVVLGVDTLLVEELAPSLASVHFLVSAWTFFL